MPIKYALGATLHGTIILLASCAVWFLSNFGFYSGSFGMVQKMDNSILAYLGNRMAFIYIFNCAAAHYSGNAAACAYKNRNKAFSRKTEFSEKLIHNKGNSAVPCQN